MGVVVGSSETSQHKVEALEFMTWATSKDYIELVGETNGWATVPPGTRKLTYDLAEYQAAAGDFVADPEVDRDRRSDGVLQVA